METATPHLDWLEALSDPATYPHPVERIEMIHTHLSVVVLTGEFAYKLKKPVDYGFADFSSLAKRKHFCERELDLNRRTAPDLYLDVLPLTCDAGAWHIRGPGQPLEYALRMRQFDDSKRLVHLVEDGSLTTDLLDTLTERILELHEKAGPCPPAYAVTYPSRLKIAIEGNFKPLPKTERYIQLRQRFEHDYENLLPLLLSRSSSGKIRDCHGDLHLQNICMWKDKPLLFDCIEFNDDYRIIDVLSDVAFLYMDLLARGKKGFAQRVLSKYLEASGDYGGLPAWSLWVAYRAQVRAKVAQLTINSPGINSSARMEHEANRDRYLKLAEDQLKPDEQKPRIIMMVGLPASGKSTLGLKLACKKGGVMIRSDVERKRLHQHNPQADLHGPDMDRQTYASLLRHAHNAVLGGQTAVLDATHLRRTVRQKAIDCAQKIGVEIEIAHCDVPMPVLRERIRKRSAAGTDVSDADEQILDKLAQTFEPFNEVEKTLLRKG